MVRSVHGDVQSENGGVWHPLRVNMFLTNGAQIRTGHGSCLYLQVNGVTSTLKLEEDTELDLKEMMVLRAGATRTALAVGKGTILGKVKKLSSESSFQVRSGEVTLEVHGKDFRMSSDGRVEAVSGEMAVQAGGKTYQLLTGEYFDPKNNEIGKLPVPEIIYRDYAVGASNRLTPRTRRVLILHHARRKHNSAPAVACGSGGKVCASPSKTFGNASNDSARTRKPRKGSG
jgi:hypothetical protein